MEALERLGFTGFVSNKSFLPFVFGAADGNRTRMVLPPRDFKSLASADFATAANRRSNRPLPYNTINPAPMSTAI